MPFIAKTERRDVAEQYRVTHNQLQVSSGVYVIHEPVRAVPDCELWISRIWTLPSIKIASNADAGSVTSCSRCNETVYEVSNPVVPDRIRELAVHSGDDADHCSHPNPLAAGLADPDVRSRQGRDITGQPKMHRESSGSAQHGKCLTGEMPVSAGSVTVSTIGPNVQNRALRHCHRSGSVFRRGASLIDLPGASAPGALFPHRAAVEGKFAGDRSAWETGSRPIVPRSTVLRGFFRGDDVRD